MKKEYLYLIALILIGILLCPAFTIASDIDDAVYYGIVQGSNNGTAAQEISTNFTANTTAWIDSDIINETATNIVMRDASGNDIAFMPGYGSNPWVVWYDSIAANSYSNHRLYTGNVSGGKICYFPDAAGMTVSDNADLELGDNFTIEFDGYIDTAAVGANITKKEDAFCVYISGTGNISANYGWRLPHDYDDPSSDWSNETNTYDGNTSTYASASVGILAWTGFLELNVGGVNTDTVRVWVSKISGGGAIDNLDVDADYSGDWQGIYLADPPEGQWINISLGSIENVTAVRLRVHNGSASLGIVAGIHEAQVGGDLVTASGISSGEHQGKIYANTDNFNIEIDGVLKDSIDTGNATVPDNSSNWIFCESDAMPYMQSTNITIDGVLQGSWRWEYGTTFTDLSSNNHDATPTFRTTSSDPDVSASLISFLPVSEAVAVTDVETNWPTLMSTPPEQPETAYTEESRPGIFFEPLVHTFWSLTGIPDSFFWYTFAFATILLAGMFTFYAFAKKNQNALLIKVIIMAAIMIFWALPGPNIYGMYVPIYFGLWCFGVIVLSKSYGW